MLDGDGKIVSNITLSDFIGTAAANISSILVGTDASESIVAGAGSDTIIGGLGADSIDLGTATNGNVVIKYNTSRESTLDSVDRISHLVLNAGGADKIDLPAEVNNVLANQTTTGKTAADLTGAQGEQTINTLLNSVNVAVDVAVLTTDEGTSSTPSKTFLAIDLDGNGAFSAATDMLIEITGADITNITSDSFI